MEFKFETEGPSLVYLLTCIIKTWVEQEGWEAGCGEEESGSGQEEGGVASVIVCMVARAQWLSAAYTRVDWEQRQTRTPQEGKWLSESFNLLL